MPARQKSVIDPTPPPIEVEPQTPEEFNRRGWILHVRGQNQAAEADFRQVIARDPGSVEGYYGLGLVLKMQQQNEAALQAFQKAIELVNAGGMSNNPTRAVMLRSLAGWHISTLKPA